MTTIELLKVLATSLTGIAAFAYYAAHVIEHGASQVMKNELVNFAQRRRLLPAARSAFKFFAFASDHYFGPRLLSWRALSRSVMLSLIWICTVLACCYMLFPNYASWLGNAMSRQLILHSGIWLVGAALLIDFLSVSLTRQIVRSSMGKGGMRPELALLLDLALSFLLFYLLFSGARPSSSPHRRHWGRSTPSAFGWIRLCCQQA